MASPNDDTERLVIYVESLKGIRDHFKGLVNFPENQIYAGDSLAGIYFPPFRIALYPMIWRVMVDKPKFLNGAPPHLH